MQIGHRQLSLLPSEMLICAGRKPLIVAVEMVNYYGVFEKELDRAGTANETDHGYQRRYRGPLIRVAESVERDGEASRGRTGERR